MGGLTAFVLPILLLFSLSARAEIAPGDLTLTVTPERNGNADPFAREMVLLRIHGVYRQPILLEEVIQPSLANFSWTQLGRDLWTKTKMPDGQNAIAFDRVVAIFPHHPGDFTIEPFLHRLTVNDGGTRKVVDVPSPPVQLGVANWTKPVGGPDAKEPWWLPAREVTITDSWSPDPETVKIGESTRRIVTLEAHGMVAEGLPPRPVMRTRGILTFAGPVTRETIITPTGPIARATYQWDVRPAIAEVIPLDAIAIPWFDTVSRTLREAEIPARQIGGGLPDRDEDAKPPAPVSPFAVAASALAAFGLGLALLGFGSPTRARPRLDRATRRALAAAASAGDAAAFRSRLAPALREKPDLAQAWRASPEIAAGLDALDATLYGRGPATGLDLADLARRLARPVPGATRPATDHGRLASLDGRT
ncbi:hypothetical protein PMNALOAF_0285 [Methylobacterium adhaesivum]|jgi:hypothetical protein|uniref:Protein BatD n=1 Tax=Methylobacterium adhaesivum TaxID=333297 RepID=A0ABT8BDY6_9HYPH|nr:hypothetical protein [Methylobacterium adhaesivum]MDN3589990.1 hypothetical protein [Methylobacterium adhaesivum]GJD29053.1 hypothetical protein PMNALOAF_0285 [Methylobacterium adhaesivum]